MSLSVATPTKKKETFWLPLPRGITCRLQVSRWNDYVEFRHQGAMGLRVETDAKRGKVCGMSLKSRLRLIAALHKIPVQLHWMTTLTYSPETAVYQTMEAVMRERPKRGQKWPVGAFQSACKAVLEAKRHLDLILRWLRSEKILVCWFMEFTKNGIPHFHLLSHEWLQCAEMSVIRKGKITTVCKYQGRHADFVNRWCVITGQTVNAFQRGGITERLRAADSAIRYVAKEASKRVQKDIFDELETGRMWGIPRNWRREADEIVVVESSYFPRFTRIFAFSDTGGRLDNGRLDVLDV